MAMLWSLFPVGLSIRKSFYEKKNECRTSGCFLNRSWIASPSYGILIQKMRTRLNRLLKPLVRLQQRPKIGQCCVSWGQVILSIFFGTERGQRALLKNIAVCVMESRHKLIVLVVLQGPYDRKSCGQRGKFWWGTSTSAMTRCFLRERSFCLAAEKLHFCFLLHDK